MTAASVQRQNSGSENSSGSRERHKGLHFRDASAHSNLAPLSTDPSLLGRNTATVPQNQAPNGLGSPDLQNDSAVFGSPTNAAHSAYPSTPEKPGGGPSPFPTFSPQQPMPFPTINGRPRQISSSFGRPRKMSSDFASRPRGRSISEQTQEAVKQLAPPISVPLVVMCLMWYFSSAVSNNLAKSILNRFPYPATLTMLQFLYAMIFSAGATLFATSNPEVVRFFPAGTLSVSGFVGPSKFVLESTGPMALFQLVGHLLSYSAMSEIPVSLVHAIKSLSPLFTVGASFFVLNCRYNSSTYLSMLPLTSGVVMTCSAEFRAKPLAIIYALVATLVFVAQNIYSKSLLTPGSSHSRKMDKMSILGWCAALAFIGTFPIWLVTDGLSFLKNGPKSDGSALTLLVLFTMNGLSHFCQNLLSFLVLGTISPVSFSIASLLKRIVVITVAIIWFGQSVTSSQGWGILISFFGLYIYDRFGKQLNREVRLPH